MLLAVMGYSGYRLWDIYSNRASEVTVRNQMLVYRPTIPHSDDTPAQQSDPVVNQSIINLQYNHQSSVGWLSIPNTWVDHPFVQGQDNSFYLHRDINHNALHAGTIFMDYRNCYNFSDFNTLIYGHNMNNGSMFGTLPYFTNQSFFEENNVGYVFLPYQTYELQIFAVAIIRPYDRIIYGQNFETTESREYFIDYVRRIALHYQDIDVTKEDRFVTLSTCRNDAANYRLVVIGVIA